MCDTIWFWRGKLTVSSTIDHMTAVTALLAAALIFIGLFSQTIQTALIYQQHKALSNKANDIIDNLLLTPGIPITWGQTDGLPAGFGLQDPEFTQYKLSPYSLMRLNSSSGQPVYYGGRYYSNITLGIPPRNFLLVPNDLSVNYSTASKLLGLNNSYGFQISLTPIVSVSVQQIQQTNPANTLMLKLRVSGVGSPLSYATISYCFLKVVSPNQNSIGYSLLFDTVQCDASGSATINVPNVSESDCFAFVAYARLGGLVGIGYTERIIGYAHVVPFVESFEGGVIRIAHSYNVHVDPGNEATVRFNATYVLLAEDFKLREMQILDDVEKIVYAAGGEAQGSAQTYIDLTIPTHNPGFIIIPYRAANSMGVVLMPWGLSAMAFPVVFGGDPSQQEWVATDMRQVTVGGITYQARISLWSLEGYQVNE